MEINDSNFIMTELIRKGLTEEDTEDICVHTKEQIVRELTVFFNLLKAIMKAKDIRDMLTQDEAQIKAYDNDALQQLSSFFADDIAFKKALKMIFSKQEDTLLYAKILWLQTIGKDLDKPPLELASITLHDLDDVNN